MRIVSRAEWGAKKASLPTSKMTLPAKELWVHHSVTDPTDDPKKDMRAIEAIGLQRFGVFSYSYCVHPDGSVLEGAGLRRGAHTSQRNSTSFGVAWIGNYQTREPNPAQVEATRWLIWWLQEEGHLRPEIYPTGGHRDLMATACPGNKLYRILDDLRQSWFPPPEPVQPATLQPAPVHDYEEATTKSTMIHIGRLDENGEGWGDWQPGLGRDPIIVGLVQQGPSPPDDGGYWDHQSKVNLSAQPRGGAVRVVVRNGTPGDTVTAFVTVA